MLSKSFLAYYATVKMFLDYNKCLNAHFSRLLLFSLFLKSSIRHFMNCVCSPDYLRRPLWAEQLLSGLSLTTALVLYWLQDGVGYLGPMEQAFVLPEVAADSLISSSRLVEASHHTARSRPNTHIHIHIYRAYTVKSHYNYINTTSIILLYLSDVEFLNMIGQKVFN